MDTNTINISESDFREFLYCQSMGNFNMLDYQSWKKFTTLTKEKWYELIKHYNKYHDLYGNMPSMIR